MSLNRRAVLSLSAVLSFATIIGLGFAVLRQPSARPRTFVVDIRVSAGTSAQLFWTSDSRFSVDRSIRVQLEPTKAFQQLRFPLPGRNVRWLRFHPTNTPAEVWITDVRLLDSDGRVLATWDPDGLRPGNQVASMTRQGESTHIVTTPIADDPFLLLSVACQDRPRFLSGFSWATPATLLATSVVFGGLLFACLILISREAFHAPGQVQEDSTLPFPRRLSALWLAGLFLIVFSARLLLMREHPVTAPFWDQWNGEAESLYIPFNNCDLSWRTMFSLHNEHRIFFTRLLALSLLMADGQWDPRLQQVVNAAIVSLAATLLAMSLWLANDRRRLDLFVFACALAFAPPFAWENILFGFQSPFMFLLLFSILALWLTMRCRALTVPWYLGWCCAACGLFTAASGVAAPVAIAAVMALTLKDDWRKWTEALWNVVTAATVVTVGLVLASPAIPGHEYLKAKTLADFGSTMARNLAWPWVDDGRRAAIVWLPMAALVALAVRRRVKTTQVERFILGLAIWVIVHAAAVAYGRGAGGPSPAARYMDFFSLGLVVNATACMILFDRTRTSSGGRRVFMAAFASWLVFVTAGETRLVGRTLDELHGWTRMFKAHEANIRKFVISGDRLEFVSRQALTEIPYPDPQVVANLLQDPYIRRILPAAIRKPLPVEPRAVAGDAFVNDLQYLDSIPRDPLVRTWSSLTNQGRRAQGRFESQPVSCQLGRQLLFQVAGYLGWERQHLRVRDLRTGQEEAVTPFRVARESWTEAYVGCPPGAFEVLAIDETADSWFAFREPVEIGRPSLFAERLIDRSMDLFLIALAMVVMAARWT